MGWQIAVDEGVVDLTPVDERRKMARKGRPKSATEFVTRGERLWPNPHSPSDEDFVFFCKVQKIDVASRDQFRHFLNELADCISQLLESINYIRPSRKERNHLNSTIKQINNAKNLVEKLSSSTRSNKSLSIMYETMFRQSLSMTAANNLIELFNFRFISYSTGENYGFSSRNWELWFRDRPKFLHWAEQVIYDHPDEIFIAILEIVRKTLSDTAEKINMEISGGGAPSHVIAPLVIMNLAMRYEELGRSLEANSKVDFRNFVVDAVQAIGLESTWVDHNLDRGIADMRLRTKKNLQ